MNITEIQAILPANHTVKQRGKGFSINDGNFTWVFLPVGNGLYQDEHKEFPATTIAQIVNDYRENA